MKIREVNWYGFNHEKVAQQFGGELTYLRTFCVNGEYQPVAVYLAKNPDLTKGHKKYMLLQTVEKKGLVRGMTEKEMAPFRVQMAIHCEKCDEVVYSIMRHHMNACSCGNVFIDGGRDYVRASVGPKQKLVSLDLITGEIHEPDPKENPKPWL